MRERIRETNFRPDTLARIEQVREIVAEYDQKLTARQVFYQLVSRDLIPNTAESYKKTTTLLTDARYAGLVDWDAIEDRGRVPQARGEFAGLGELVDAALSSYRLPRWADQPNYVELWVEKQALAGVLWPIAARHHVTLMVNKGYSSASAMKESADRIKARSGTAAALSAWLAAQGIAENDDEPDSDNFEGTEDYEDAHAAWAGREKMRAADRRRYLASEKKNDTAWQKKTREACKRSTILYLGDHERRGHGARRQDPAVRVRLRPPRRDQGRADDAADREVQAPAEPGQGHRLARSGVHREVRRQVLGVRRAPPARAEPHRRIRDRRTRRRRQDARGQGAREARQNPAARRRGKAQVSARPKPTLSDLRVPMPLSTWRRARDKRLAVVESIAYSGIGAILVEYHYLGSRSHGENGPRTVLALGKFLRDFALVRNP